MRTTIIIATAIAAIALTHTAQAHEYYSGRAAHIRHQSQIRNDVWNAGYDRHADRVRRIGSTHRHGNDDDMSWNDNGGTNGAGTDAGHSFSRSDIYGGGAGPRPRAWCGWQMRQLVDSDPGPAFNLAANWAHWDHSGPPGIGAIVVWAHHVGKIVGQENGQWIIQSGNDGNRLRARPQSIAGAIAIRWS